MVRIFDLQYTEEFAADFTHGCAQIWRDGYLTNHRFVSEFERDFARSISAQTAVAVTNGSAALEIALRALELSGSVILPTNTFVATAQAVLRAGLTPLVVDTDDEGQLSLESVKAALAECDNASAVIVVSLGGLVPRGMGDLLGLCESKGIKLIEDAAHGHGSSWHGRAIGTLGDASAFSFHQTKTMTTGEGGMVIAKNQAVIERAKRLRCHGHSAADSRIYDSMGFNYKMSEFCGLLGVLELKRSVERILRRREIHAQYLNELKGVEGLNVLSAAPGTESGYYKQIMISEIPRQKIEDAFKVKGIQMTNGVYYFPLHRQPVMANHIDPAKKFVNSDYFADHHFCPPCYPEMTDDQVALICATLRKAHS